MDLFEKQIALEILRQQQMQSQYRSVDFRDLTKQMPPHYDKLLRQKELKDMRAWQNATYDRCPYYPERLTHRTAYGEYVRSKGEAIIANALYGFGIPYHYEEALLFPDNTRPYYPDFKIRLPYERYLYWEHWGLLNKERYRRDNTEKLAAYQENGLIIGDNLIITQDDVDGNCQSHVVYNLIENMILPHFEGIPLL